MDKALFMPSCPWFFLIKKRSLVNLLINDALVTESISLIGHWIYTGLLAMWYCNTTLLFSR